MLGHSESGIIQDPTNTFLSQITLLKINVGQGLDCIGELIKASDQFLTFKSLRVIIYEPVPPNGVKVASFMHFLIPAGDAELDIRDADIVTMLPCPANFAALYREAVTGFQIARELPAVTRRM